MRLAQATQFGLPPSSSLSNSPSLEGMPFTWAAQALNALLLPSCWSWLDCQDSQYFTISSRASSILAGSFTNSTCWHAFWSMKPFRNLWRQSSSLELEYHWGKALPYPHLSSATYVSSVSETFWSCFQKMAAYVLVLSTLWKHLFRHLMSSL